LQYLPFEEVSFDVVYSSGVIHHTNNTELSLLLIEPLLKCGGKICLWLYHPQQKIIHKAILLLRKVTKRLPLKLAFILLTIFVFPITFLAKKIKRKNVPNYREEIIDLLDIFTPEFRFEIQQDLASVWLRHKKYDRIQITTVNQFGFSIVGNKRII
jgi:SAM-dependent methyltransferase